LANSSVQCGEVFLLLAANLLPNAAVFLQMFSRYPMTMNGLRAGNTVASYVLFLSFFVLVVKCQCGIAIREKSDHDRRLANKTSGRSKRTDVVKQQS